MADCSCWGHDDFAKKKPSKVLLTSNYDKPTASAWLWTMISLLVSWVQS